MESSYIAGGNVQSFCIIVGQLLKELNTKLPYDPTSPLLGMYPRELKIHKNLLMNIHSSSIQNGQNTSDFFGVGVV